MKAMARTLFAAGAAAAAMMVAACAGDGGAAAPTTPATGGTGGAEYRTVEVQAPIENIDIVIRESWPPQYAVRVTSGLPSGCARFERITHSISAYRIEIEVINTVPAPDELVACTMIYGYHESTVELGSDFESGKTYTVSVNGVEKTFAAQ